MQRLNRTMASFKEHCQHNRTFLFVCVVLSVTWCLSTGQSADVNLGDVDCKFQLHKSRCQMGNICRFRCKYSCVNVTETIWGTEIYTYDSPLCRSAVHDLRISPWNTTSRTAYVKRISDTRKYLGSVRQGIRTEDYGKLGYPQQGAFQFVSPRIEEEILDVTSLHRGYLYVLSDHGSTQECHIGLSAGQRKLHFVMNSPSNSLTNLVSTQSPVLHESKSNLSRWGSVTWPSTLEATLRTGGFWCNVERSVYSNIMSLSMREDADILPSKFTVTVSVGDYAQIEMTSQKRLLKRHKIVWAKDGQPLSSNGLMLKRPFLSAQIGDGGLYSASVAERQGTDTLKRAIVRLIVRVCPAGKTGQLCKEDCPKCENGGVCHDVMNMCICPPGFNGSRCEIGCGADRFGRDCTSKCSDTNPDRNEGCGGILFCLPDPYGCSCAAGFKGQHCNITCDEGEYGADCQFSRECHCEDEKPCSPYTGTCPDGCDDGWYGMPYCNISFPYFSHPPTSSNITDSSVTLTFKDWSRDVDEGTGVPSGYSVEYRELSPRSWIIGQQMPANSKENYEVVIEDLKPDKYYYFRVVVIDASGKTQKKKAPDISRRTLCGEPLEPPEFTFINASSPNVVEVGWNKPPMGTWQCRDVSVFMSFNNSNRSLNVTISSYQDSFSFQSAPYELWWISLRLVTKNGLYGPPTEIKEIRTAQDAPSEVQDVEVDPSVPGTIKVKWKKPLKENGIITGYRIVYKQTGWRHYCSASIDTLQKVVVSVEEHVLITAVKPSAIYEVQVKAVTIMDGPLSSPITVQTAEGLPSGPPEKLNILSVSSNHMTVGWNPPSCEHSSGLITGYFIKCEGLDEWDLDVRNATSVGTDFLIPSLIPYTNYKVLVAAGTSMGYSTIFSEVRGRTGPGIPSSPKDVLIYQKTPDLLAITWKPPYPPYGEIDHYNIRVVGASRRTITAFPPETQCEEEIRKNNRCYTIGNLEPRKKYTISVVAYNKDVKQPSSPSNEVTGETKESLPGPPSSVDVVRRTNSSLKIIWEQPYILNGNLTSYRLNLTAVDSFNASVIGDFQSVILPSSEDQTYLFNDLYPATVYNISVEAETIRGFGEATTIQSTTKHNAPAVNKDIEIVRIGESTVDVLLHQVLFEEGPVSAYYVIVEENYRGDVLEFERAPIFNYNTSVAGGLHYYSAAKFLPKEFSSTVLNFTVGDGNYYGGYYNAPLLYGKRYNFGLAVQSNLSGDVRYGYKVLSKTIFVRSPYNDEMNETASVVGAVLGVFTVFLFIIIAAIVIFLYRRPATLIKVQNSFKIMDPNHKEIVPYGASVGESNFIIENDAEMEDVKSHKIPLSTLEDYVTNVIEMGGLKHEFLGINKGQLSSWEYAKKTENKSKNRFGNLLPYDHTRVILDPVDNEPFTDYINANYIDGYEAPAKYIATQGPKPLTINDFWRMIWQVESCKIIMVTNLVENGKTICEKYWPDTVETYGKISVTLVKTDVFADFIIRTFEIEKGEESRKVKQFHFTSWPDHGVPMYSVSVVTFLKRVRAFKPNSTAPIVVHCSAGIGRTGTIILLDAMLDMARKEQYVDILGHLCKMRQQRVNLVQVLEQYVFVHQALVEAICYEGMSILCSEFFVQYNRLKQVDPNTGQLHLELQLQRLNRLTPPLKSHFCHGAIGIENKHKNRRSEILPPDRARPYLKEANENKSNYINAVYVNGYKRKDAFIATQLPYPHTVSDFWQMIYETNSKTIVLLNEIDPNDQSCPQYWPNDTPVMHGKLTISCMSTEVLGDIVVRTFCISENIYQNSVSNKVIKQFQLKGWKQSAKMPHSAEVMVDLIDKVERWQKQISNPPVTVQCYDGNRACGLYCASVFVCDKIKTEQEVDVFLAVRSIRTNRPQFIEDKDQYQFLFNVAVAFLDSFETYSNFK